MSNENFTGVVNISNQISNINVSNLTASNANIVDLTVDAVTVDNLNVTDLTVIGTILASDGTEAAPSYSFTSDTNTGIYHSAADSIGFSAGGVLRAAINDDGTGQLGVTNGTAAEPSYTFLNDRNTGIYLVDKDTVGISTGEEQKITVASIVPPVGMINGLNVGTTGAVSGIQRLSATAANSWEDGYMGNSNAIVFTPTDFNNNTPASRPVVINLLNVGITTYVAQNGSIVDYIAIKMIPKGFRITTDSVVTIYAEDAAGWAVDPTVIVQSTILGVPSTTGGSIGSTALIRTSSTPDVLSLTISDLSASIIGDGNTMVCLVFQPLVQLSAAGEGLLGASITMERV